MTYPPRAPPSRPRGSHHFYDRGVYSRRAFLSHFTLFLQLSSFTLELLYPSQATHVIPHYKMESSEDKHWVWLPLPLSQSPTKYTANHSINRSTTTRHPNISSTPLPPLSPVQKLALAPTTTPQIRKSNPLLASPIPPSPATPHTPRRRATTRPAHP